MKIQYVLIWISLLVLSSCKPEMAKFDSLGFIERGMRKGDVEEKIGTPITKRFSFKSNNLAYDVSVISVIVGTLKKNKREGLGFGKSRDVIVVTEIYDHMLLLYKDGKIHYWGFINEFSKCEDPEVTAVSPLILTEYNKYYD